MADRKGVPKKSSGSPKRRSSNSYAQEAALLPQTIKSDGKAQLITTALYSYTPEAEGEIVLTRGKLVVLLSMEGNFWFGECQGEVGFFPRSFVRNPNEGSLTHTTGSSTPRMFAALCKGAGEESGGGGGAGGSGSKGSGTDTIADLKKQLILESQQVAELRKAKAALEALVLTKSAELEEDRRQLKDALASGGSSASSTYVEDLRQQLEKKKVEIADVVAKKNKYKKHAKAADAKLAVSKKESAELEALRVTKAEMDKKLEEMQREYSELEEEVHTLEEENSSLQAELAKAKKK